MTAEIIIYIAIAASWFATGYYWRNIRALKAIHKMAALHRRNVSQAYERGHRDGLLKQMELETINARSYARN